MMGTSIDQMFCLPACLHSFLLCLPSLQLFFAKVLRSANEDEVKALFARYGRVMEVNLFRAFQVGCVLSAAAAAAAAAAIRELLLWLLLLLVVTFYGASLFLGALRSAGCGVYPMRCFFVCCALRARGGSQPVQSFPGGMRVQCCCCWW
jgi:hypothetical protein